MRNKYLTPAMERVLAWMASDIEDDGELVTEAGQAWYGLERTNMATVNNLLRLCLIRDEGGDGFAGKEPLKRYTINEEGRAILKDSNYVPSIFEKLSIKASK